MYRCIKPPYIPCRVFTGLLAWSAWVIGRSSDIFLYNDTGDRVDVLARII